MSAFGQGGHANEGLGSAPVWGSRAAWQMRMRWVVPPAMVIGLAIGRAMGWHVPVGAVLLVAAFVLVYNAVFWLVLTGRAGTRTLARWIARRAAVLQVALDYAVVFTLIVLTGGIVSPLVPFLLFHVVFAAILLPPSTAWLFAIVAGGGLALVVAGQALGLFPTPHVFGDAMATAPPSAFVGGYVLAFSVTALVLAGVVAAIMERLRVESARALRATGALAEERERLTLQVVHNLRAPLGASVGLLDLVITGVFGPVNDEQREYVERAVRRLRGMGDALGDLLALAQRGARGSSAPTEPVDVAALARDVTNDFAPVAEARGLHLEVDVPAPAVVTGDRQALAEVLENLVSNAIRYTPGGGTVRVGVAAVGGSSVEVSVEDTGIGIPSGDKDRVFDEFFRSANAKSADASGTGLGLAIVHQVVAQHGGRVSLESEEGVGTMVRVVLPVGRPPAVNHAPTPFEPEDSMIDEPVELATLGGGCFWCLEASFELLRGVRQVVSGYAGGHVRAPSYAQVCGGGTGHAEVVQVTFEPGKLAYEDLLRVFFTIHDPTTPNRQGADIGPQYRSIVLTHDEAQRAAVARIIAEIGASGVWDAPIVTEVVPLDVFYPAEAHHQGYYRRNARQPYCQAVIRPKVAKLRKEHTDRLAM